MIILRFLIRENQIREKSGNFIAKNVWPPCLTRFTYAIFALNSGAASKYKHVGSAQGFFTSLLKHHSETPL